MHITQIQEYLTNAIHAALERISKKYPKANLPKNLHFTLEVPKDPKHGDLTTNVALRLAKVFSTQALTIARDLQDEVLEKGSFRDKRLSDIIGEIKAIPPGFLNFCFKKDYLYDVLSKIIKDGAYFAKSNIGKSESVNIEFVSANPTGPLTIAHGRQAAVGDALGRILGFAGYKVTREYFLNDVGNQIDILGKSIHARYLEENKASGEFPENGYKGAYIKDIAKELNKKYGTKLIDKNDKNLELISEFGVEAILRIIKTDLASFGVSFDKWFSQKKLSSAIIKNVLKKLEEKGYTYKKDGALWFKSTSLGDDKDRVVIKSNGAFTYLAPDIAYHLNKYKRKFKKIIDIWGPDHHGYISRLKASCEALGYDRKSISILIVQLATLFRDGVAVSMSTRSGEFVTLREVIDEVGCDVAKFFFLMRKLDSHLDFDLAVAKKKSLDNPVYYIQYAHARIASIKDFSEKLRDELNGLKYDAGLLIEPDELLVLRMLNRFPLVVIASARNLEPYRIVEFLNELAKIFHSFYTKHRVVIDADLPLTKARLALVGGVKIVLAGGLDLLGISFPERM